MTNVNLMCNHTLYSLSSQPAGDTSATSVQAIGASSDQEQPSISGVNLSVGGGSGDTGPPPAKRRTRGETAVITSSPYLATLLSNSAKKKKPPVPEPVSSDDDDSSVNDDSSGDDEDDDEDSMISEADVKSGDYVVVKFVKKKMTT